jgi:hypothetical protein
VVKLIADARPTPVLRKPSVRAPPGGRSAGAVASENPGRRAAPTSDDRGRTPRSAWPRRGGFLRAAFRASQSTLGELAMNSRKAERFRQQAGRALDCAWVPPWASEDHRSLQSARRNDTSLAEGSPNRIFRASRQDPRPTGRRQHSRFHRPPPSTRRHAALRDGHFAGRGRQSEPERSRPGLSSKKCARASRGPTSLKIDQIHGSPLENRLYCFLYTFVLFTASPFAFVPVWVMVMVLPSADTTTFDVVVAFPPFFQVFS